MLTERHGSEGPGAPLLYLSLQVAEAGIPALLQFLREARPCYEEPGDIRLRLLRSRDRPGAYLEVIEYADWPCYEADQKRVKSDPKVKALLERWRGLLEAVPEVETYEDVTHLLEGPNP